LLAATERGICALYFGETEGRLKAALAAKYPTAELRHEDESLRSWLSELRDYLEGRRDQPDLPLDTHGTPFQERVWQELRRIPRGQTRSYREVARTVGRPAAFRAVGRACATNPVAVLNPCHRVVRTDGGLGGFASGLSCKEWLLAWEKDGA
jgi:AraC family transcriptional regulator of adaptative response/methylated-DNA-[protein]-cysteine methyltransferase